MPETVRASLLNTGVTPDCLRLEISESVAHRDPERTVEAISRFRQ